MPLTASLDFMYAYIILLIPHILQPTNKLRFQGNHAILLQNLEQFFYKKRGHYEQKKYSIQP